MWVGQGAKAWWGSVDCQLDSIWSHLGDKPPGTPVGGIYLDQVCLLGITLIWLTEVGRITVKKGNECLSGFLEKSPLWLEAQHLSTVASKHCRKHEDISCSFVSMSERAYVYHPCKKLGGGAV